MATKKPTRAEAAIDEFAELFQEIVQLEFLLSEPLELYLNLCYADKNASTWNELFNKDAPKDAVSEVRKAIPSFSHVIGKAIDIATELYGKLLMHPGWRTPGKHQPNCGDLMDDVFELLHRNHLYVLGFVDTESLTTEDLLEKYSCEILENIEWSRQSVEAVKQVVFERGERAVRKLPGERQPDAIEKLMAASVVKKRINNALPTYVKEKWRWELEPLATPKLREDQTDENAKDV